MTTNYAYGHNPPGCLPDNPQFIAATFEDARSGLLWDLRFFEATRPTRTRPRTSPPRPRT